MGNTHARQQSECAAVPPQSQPQLPAVLSKPAGTDSFVKERIFLIWTARSVAHFTFLSKNVIREIAYYLANFKYLQMIQGDSVFFFDIGHYQWKRNFYLSEDLSQFYYMSYALAVIDNSSMVVCGGHKTKVRAHYINSGTVLALPHMIKSRFSHGAVFVWEKNSVYVFGGAAYLSMRTAEFFNFATGKWVQISDMAKSRARFTPSLHHGKVFLCGGDIEHTVETYDWASDTFTLIVGLHLPIGLACVAAFAGDVCICISEESSCRWSVSQRRVISTYSHKDFKLQSIGMAVAVTNLVFVVNGNGCLCFCVEKEISMMTWKQTIREEWQDLPPSEFRRQ